ncbi:MAG: hypothetical protein NC121_03475 [Blautia sp.]|nr:hypothetical protein [Blautia sp.]
MEFNINSPAYFSQQYGVDDEVYGFCHKAHVFFKDKEYSDTLHMIGIMPVAAPQAMYDSGKWKERIRFIGNKSCVDITVRMDFDRYYAADSFGKVEQIREMVLQAVKKVRSRGKFDCDRFEKDFLLMLSKDLD